MLIEDSEDREGEWVMGLMVTGCRDGVIVAVDVAGGAILRCIGMGRRRWV